MNLDYNFKLIHPKKKGFQSTLTVELVQKEASYINTSYTVDYTNVFNEAMKIL